MICPTELLFEQLPRSRASRSKAWNHHAMPPINSVEKTILSPEAIPVRLGSLGSVFEPMKMKKIARIHPTVAPPSHFSKEIVQLKIPMRGIPAKRKLPLWCTKEHRRRQSRKLMISFCWETVTSVTQSLTGRPSRKALTNHLRTRSNATPGGHGVLRAPSRLTKAEPRAWLLRLWIPFANLGV